MTPQMYLDAEAARPYQDAETEIQDYVNSGMVIKLRRENERTLLVLLQDIDPLQFPNSRDEVLLDFDKHFHVYDVVMGSQLQSQMKFHNER